MRSKFVRDLASYASKMAIGYAGKSAINYFNRNRKAIRKYRMRTPLLRDSVGVTEQRDFKVQYKKPTGKKYKRAVKRRVKFRKAVQRSTVGTTRAIRNSTISGTWFGGSMTSASTVLGGFCGLDANMSIGNNDIEVMTNANADERVDEQNERMVMRNASLDLTFTNTGQTKLEVDVYTVYTKKNSMTKGKNILWDLGAAGNFEEEPVPTTGPSVYTNVIQASTSVGNVTRGVTPFVPVVGRMGYSIGKKTKFFVDINETFTLNLRTGYKEISRLDMYNLALIGETKSHSLDGYTKQYLFYIKNVAGTSAELANAFAIGATRTYHYQVVQDNRDLGGLITV